MRVRRYTSEDYPLLSIWWKGHGWEPIPKEFLPASGFIVEECCAGFLYRTDSKVCLMEWLISDPCSDSKGRSDALAKLIEALLEEASNYGFKAIHTSIKHPRLKDRLVSRGFTVADEGMINMIGRLS